MDPSKDKNYLFMIKMAKKKYKLDKFVRFSDNKFVEDNDELIKIGKELLNNFMFNRNIKITFFADICSSPGNYSQIILDSFDIKTGIGISLPPEEGGVEYIIDNPKFKKVYKNILDKKYRLEIPEKLDFGIASCVSYENNSKNASILNLELILKSIYLLLPNFNVGANLIVNMTMKNIFFIFNLINILSKYFTSIKLWKSSVVWETKNTFYFFGYNYTGNNNIVNNLNDIINIIHNKDEPIFKQFLGTETEYTNINNIMKNIYQIRINALKKLQ